MSAVPYFVGDHDIDTTTLDIIESTLENTRYEMDRVLETTAISPVIREQSDQFPLIADAQGRMVMGQFGSAIETIIENATFDWDDLNDGDVIATNDPYMCAGAMSHTPDMLLLRPIFYEGERVGFSSQWGNLMDVGGKTPGSMPVEATSIFEEGIRLPPVKLYKEGELDEDILEIFAHNTRLPEHAEADIKALAAGTAAAKERVQELCDRFGKGTYMEGCDAILDRTRDGMIDLIREFIPEGERYAFEDYVDDDGMGNGPIKLHLEIHRENDTVYLDWEGTNDQVPGTVNFLLNEKMFKMFTGVFLIMAFDPLLTFNDGYYDLFEVNLPMGTVIQPESPAALGNRLPLMARQFDVLQATFSKLIDGFSVAGSYGTSPNLVYAGVDSDGNPFQMLEILYGGIPARPGGDGLDGHSWWPLFRTVPAEYQEAYYPLTIDEYSTREDTAVQVAIVVGTASRRSTPSRKMVQSPSKMTVLTPTRGALMAANTVRRAKRSSSVLTAPRRSSPRRLRTSPFRQEINSSSAPPAVVVSVIHWSATRNSSYERPTAVLSPKKLLARNTA